VTVALELWQVLVGIVAALGFSAAPWIAALLANKLITIGIHRERMAEKEATIARLEREVAYEQTAKATQEKRADDAIASVAALAGEMGQTTVHLLKSLPGVGDGT
jgi:hypothetical protein